MYLVSAGVLQVLHEGQVVAEHGPGSWVGEGAILTGEPRSADVVVSEAAVLYRLGVDDFRAVVETLDGFQNTLQALHERRKVALEAVSGR